MRVVFTGAQFECRCNFADRNTPKSAGFRWDTKRKIWFTENYGVAARLSTYLDDCAKNEIAKHRITIETWTGGLSVPQGLLLLDFQVNACLFALSRNRSYLGLDPGLGKTPIAAVITQTLFDACKLGRAIYICPPFLTRNTKAEFEKWAPDCTTEIYSHNNNAINYFRSHVVIVPDSIIGRPEVQNAIKELLWAESGNSSGLLFTDEAHRFKNETAQRTKSLFGEDTEQGHSPGIADLFTKIVYLSGTPMPNRPIELFPVLNHSAQQCILGMSKHEYAVKYCGAFENGFGWDYNGATNLDELRAQVIGSFMMRTRKKDAIDLPPKVSEMVVLSENLSPKLTKLSEKILKELSAEDLMSGRIQMNLGADVLHLSTYRKELGIHKAKASADFIKYILEETEENLLVFAIHKEVIATLDSELSKYCPLVVTGSTRMELRHEMVKTFQTDKKHRLFIGNIQAAGVGLTLTKATRVVFVEFSWVPSDNDQASDRPHRIGQTEDVLVQYLVYENSVDKAVIETVLRKQKVTAKI